MRPLASGWPANPRSPSSFSFTHPPFQIQPRRGRRNNYPPGGPKGRRVDSPILLTHPCVDEKGDRAVVDECDLHHRAEAAGGDLAAKEGGEFCDHHLVKRNRNGGPGGAVPAWAGAF